MLKDFQKVYGKNTILFRIAEASLEKPSATVQEVIYPIAGESTLTNLVKEFKSSGSGYKNQVHTLIRSSYGGHYRRMLPKLLELLKFKSNNTLHRPVLEALEWIADHRESKQQYIILNDRVPIDGVIKPKWREVVIEKQGKTRRINRINYEICVLQMLREKLRCKEIWVEGADKYRDPDEDLPTDFEEKRNSYYQILGHTQDAAEFVSQLKSDMGAALSHLNNTIPKNKHVRLKPQGKNRISVSPYEPLPDPENILSIKSSIQEKWPMTSLLDVLKESDLRIDFTSRFSSVASRERLSRDEIQRRLLLVLYALGTNAGIKRLADGPHGFGYRELLHVRNQFVHKDSLRAAIRDVVNATLRARNPDIWGEGTTAC
ncbi:Tn3 family transposase, partial [Oleiphilus sp. HI0128]